MASRRHADTVALVTGAASGIGRATALLLASDGARVVATDTNVEGLATLVSEDDEIVAIDGDITDAGFVDELVRRAEVVGQVNVVANVAGVMDHFVPAGEVTDELWDHVIAVNLTAPMRVCRAVLPMMSTRGGSIVNVSSAAGLGGSGAGAAYHASKHGLIGLTKHIAYTYGAMPVRCNAICPGGTATGIGSSATPQVTWAFERQLPAIALAGRTATPEQIAGTIAWLTSNEASLVKGAILPVDDGWKSA